MNSILPPVVNVSFCCTVNNPYFEYIYILMFQERNSRMIHVSIIESLAPISRNASSNNNSDEQKTLGIESTPYRLQGKERTNSLLSNQLSPLLLKERIFKGFTQ